MQLISVTSTSNPQLQMIRKLRDRKGRREYGAFVTEGLRSVQEALMAGQKPIILVLSESFQSALLPEIASAVETCQSALSVSDDFMARISDTENPQGILAVFSIPEPQTWKSILSPTGRYAMLERVQDPGNVGTIIRTADACAFDAVLLMANCADVYNSKVMRSTMGSIWHLPVLTIAEGDEEALIHTMQGMGIRVLAADPKGEKSLWETDLSSGFGIVIGNEANGLSEKMKTMVDTNITIPMPGKSESLNAAVAAAILMMESVRQVKL